MAFSAGTHLGAYEILPTDPMFTVDGLWVLAAEITELNPLQWLIADLDLELSYFR